MNFEQPSTPEKKKPLYKTLEKPVTEELKALGYEGTASVEVFPVGNQFFVLVNARFREGIDMLDLLPDTVTVPTLEEAKKVADDMIERMDDWK